MPDPTRALPAARMGDPHACAHAGGGPVLGPCEPHVLIGDQVAARLTDLLLCGASPDMIATAEPTVTIGGLPAARQTDITLHPGGGVDSTGMPLGGNGLITLGYATVLIGGPILGKAARMMWRRALIEYARAHSGNGALPEAERNALASKAGDLELLNRAADLIHIATDTYEYPYWTDDQWRAAGLLNTYTDYQPPEGYERAQLYQDANTGFLAYLYRSTIDGSYVLAYRGTNDGRELMNPFSADNIGGNIPQALGMGADQYSQAADLARRIAEETGGNVTITGHSLGGGLASIGSLASQIPAFTFDAAGLHPNSVAQYGGDIAQAQDLIHAYHLNGDFLTRMQTEGVYGSLMGGAAGFGPDPRPRDQRPWLSGELGPGFFPDAAGQGHSVPNTPEQIAATQQATRDFGEMIAAFGLHDPWALYKAIEAQKGQLIDELCGSLAIPRFVG